MAKVKTGLTITKAGNDEEQLEISYVTSRNVQWWNFIGKQFHSSSKANTFCVSQQH